MPTITLTIQLDHRLAKCLGSSSGSNFIASQPDRFSMMALHGVEDPAHDDIAPLLSPDFEGGVMT